MYFYLATIFILLSISAPAYSHGDDAESVSVADFKSSFTGSGIVPDVLAAFSPSVVFYVGFKADDGNKALLEPGVNLKIAEAKAPFELSVENIGNATNVTSSSRFIVYMVCQIDPKYASAAHYRC